MFVYHHDLFTKNSIITPFLDGHTEDKDLNSTVNNLSTRKLKAKNLTTWKLYCEAFSFV